MQISTFSSREFNQHVSEAKKAAEGDAVVYITDRGVPAHVLMSIGKYRQLVGKQQSIVDLLTAPQAAEIDFDPVRLKDLPRSVDLS